MKIIGFSGLHQSVPFKKSNFADLDPRAYRVLQGFDSAAALVGDEGIIAAAAEERFTREKTTGAFPVNAIKYCLEAANLSPADIDYVAHGFSYEPFKEYFTMADHSKRLFDEVYSADVQQRNLEEFFPSTGLSGKLVSVNHHLAHAASAFYPSGFEESLILISDGMGEVHSATIAVGHGRDIEVLRTIPAVDSLGILYGVFTLYLGFWFAVDEYKIMGLAPYGDPLRYERDMSELIELEDDGTYAIPVLSANRSQLEKETHGGVLRELEKRFGPAREPGSEISQRHKDLAAALQAALQTCQLHVLRHFRQETKMANVCLAGGVALNCSANGVIKRSGLFDAMFVQPASGDDGTALGAALHVHRLESRAFEPRRMRAPLWGPEFDRRQIEEVLTRRNDCEAKPVEGFDSLCREVAQRLAGGEIAAWYQGRMEFGPRALGNRSILADPRHEEMRDRINALVKKREEFRPFAPIVTEEAASEYFEIDEGEEEIYAHMLLVTRVRESFRAKLPAVTHVDGSARPQTVSKQNYPRLWRLLRAFEAEAGLPVLLNTSFNVKGQPVVCTPEEAVDTFLFSRLDFLVLGDFVVEPRQGEEGKAARRRAGERIAIGVG